MSGPKDNLGATNKLKSTMKALSELTKQEMEKVVPSGSDLVATNEVVQIKQISEEDLALLPAQINRELMLLEKEKVLTSANMISAINVLLKDAMEKSKDASLFSIAQAIGVIADKIQLLSGGATIRIESKEEIKSLSLNERGDIYDKIIRGSNGKKS